MNAIQKDFRQAGNFTTNNHADAAEKFAIESQRPMFVRKIFCRRQSFSQNIKAWEGPMKSYPPIGPFPPTDW